jgi:2-polyprenyl-3-methyl-5-hydroxy-6-metoxy-1,4-benzoquinol methylase
MNNDSYQRFRDFYTTGGLPWDQELPPPEVIAEIEALPPGRALDLGCGYGRAAIYLAYQGWQVDAVDFVPQAITVARLRAAATGVHIQFHLSPVTDLQHLSGPIDYALDVGCAHSLDYTALAAYHDHLARLLRPGARLMIFARLRDENEDVGENGPRGLPVNWLKTIFAREFILDRDEYGMTETPNGTWGSGWFWLRKR